MSQRREHHLAKGMRWARRIIGLGAAIFLLVMLTGAAISELLNKSDEPITVAGILLGAIGAMALSGAILSWWREWLAGILLVLTAVGLAIHIGVYAGHNHILAWFMLGFPYLVAGSLILTSWHLSKQATWNGNPE